MWRRISLTPSFRPIWRSGKSFCRGWNYLASKLEAQIPLQVLSFLPFFCLHAEFPFCDIHTEASRTRQVLSDAEHSLRLTQDELQTAREDLSDLFDPTGFGAAGEWKKLDGLCLEKDTGECVPSAIRPLTWCTHLASRYTYEVCLFDEARQKPNKGGSSFSLG